MKTPRTKKLLAFLLVIAISLTLFPAQALAIDLSSIGQQEENIAQVSSRLLLGEESSVSSRKTAESKIISEILSGRDKYQKEFLLANGQHMIAVYSTPVHFQKNGQWEGIDNTLKLTKENGVSVYHNTAGTWDVTLPSQMTATQPVSVQQDGYKLSFQFAGQIQRTTDVITKATEQTATEQTATEQTVTGQAATQQTVTEQTTVVQQSAARVATGSTYLGESIDHSVVESLDLAENEQPMLQSIQISAAVVSTVQVESDDTQQQLHPIGMHAVAEYTSIYDNSDLKYDLTASRLKESVIIKDRTAVPLGYLYHINTTGLTLALQEDGSILAYKNDAAEKSVPVYRMPAPFLLDANKSYCSNVQVKLLETENGYDLYYLLPTDWMSDGNRAYPVVLDPILEPVSNSYTIRDQSVFEFDQLSYQWGMLECGWNSRHGRERIFLKFNNLPTLTSADVIVNASISMLKYGYDDATNVMAFKVNDEWDSASITWSNQPSCNPDVEEYQAVGNSGWYNWDITDIAQGWYKEQSNTGVMFRLSDWVESGHESWLQFYSSDYSPSYAPVLTISYINNCGLEGIWDYTSKSAGTAGTGHINNYTGNLVWTTNSFGFDGCRMPVSITHIYNANDKGSNIASAGYGWRTNYHQRIYQFTQDSSYYVWEDGDGTRHYLKYKSIGTYEDELNSGLILTTTGSGNTKYCLTDKDSNKSYFTSAGYLYRITNNQATTSSITISYSGAKISQVTDAVGRVYAFYYNTDGFLSKIAFMGSDNTEHASETFSYASGNLLSIQSSLSGTASFAYTYNHLLLYATDADGYQLRYSYNTSDATQPNRIIRVSEYDGSIVGGTQNIEYSHNQTAFRDHNGNKEIHQFNNFGSTVSIQDGQGHGQFYRYASNNNNGEITAKDASQMTLSSKLQSTVVNLLRNSNFEQSAFWGGKVGNASDGLWGYVSGEHYMGNKAIQITRTASGTPYSVRVTSDSVCRVYPGKSYTLSAYIKTTANMSTTGDGAQLMLQLLSNDNMVVASEPVKSNTNWTRVEITYNHPADAQADFIAANLSNTSTGSAFFDCVQLEESTSASRYNILENGDFRTGASGNQTVFGWTFGSGCTSSDMRTTMSDNAAPNMDSNALRMEGSTIRDKEVYQAIGLSGSAGDVYTLGGWAKGNSTPLYSDRKFGIGLRFYYTDGTTGEQFDSFNPDCNSQNDWQYLASRAVAAKPYSSVRVFLVYSKNANVVYLDGIQLYKEEFGHSYVYDANDNIISVTDLQTKNTTYEYTNNNLTKITLPSGARQTYTYDNHHNVLTATSPEGVVAAFNYDTYGNNTKVTVGGSSQAKISSTATYTSDGNLLATITDALGNTAIYGHNPQTGVLKSVQTPGQTVNTRTEYIHGSRFRLYGVKQGSAQVNYAYSGELLSTITSPSGTAYRFNYGNFDLVNSVQIGQRALISHTYSSDANHHLTQSTYGNGDSVSYTYDSLERTTAKTYENGDTVDYSYDNSGNLGLLKDSASGRTTKYYYDFQDRLMRYDESGTDYSNSVQWGYDDENNLTSETQRLNGSTYTTNYTYDNDNRLTQSKEGNITAKYTYDALSRMTTISNKQGSTTVVNTAIGYRDSGSTATSSQVQTWRNTAGGNIVTYTYTYDNRGNITALSDGANTTTYVYDSLDQLTRENNQAEGKTWIYAYDNGGNILSKTEYAYTTGALGTASATISYTYGDTAWPDLLTAYDGHTLTVDDIGNLTNDGTWSYTWQHGRQLSGMSKSDTNIAYDYNADGRRISKTVNGTTYNYHYLGDTLTEITWGNDKLHFTYDAIGPATITYNGTTYYYLKNAQGDVTGIVNSNGTQVVGYTYDAWGAPLPTNGSMAGSLGQCNPFRYRGYVYDTETGLYYLQTRYYNPKVGRFISADAFASTDIGGVLSANAFSYCENNPVMRVDYNGEWIQFVVGAVVGSGLEVLTQLATGTKMCDIRWADVAIQGAVGAISSSSIAFKAVSKAANVAANISKNVVASIIGESVSQSINHNKSKGKTVAIGTQATIDTLVDRGSEYLIGSSKAKVAKVVVKIIKNTFSFTYGISIEALFSRRK